MRIGVDTKVMEKKTKLFRNKVIDKKQLKQIMTWAFNDFGMIKASYLANKLKDIGFQYATQAGLSISIEDLRVPPIKSTLIKAANKKVSQAAFEVDRGEITEVERFQKVINTWTMTSETLKDQVIHYFRQTDPLNSIYMMAFSGARGNLSQVRQLVGMRGLMADPNGQIIDLPIVANFREGLTVTDYIISSYGARKGLVDTALRTADSGYLTRRLIDVAQDMITREKNCQTKDGVRLTNVFDGNNLLISLEERMVGRLLSLPLVHPKSKDFIASADQQISPGLAKKIAELHFSQVTVRSPLTCALSRSICQLCYGWNLAYGNLIDLGEAVGIIAAQSIGEPGTQLTMRTFHTGGVFTSETSRQIRAQFSGKILFSKILKTQVTRTQYGEIAYISENEASLSLITYQNSKIELEILPETFIYVKDHSFVRQNDVLYELAPKTGKTGGEKAFKYLYANQSGEVLLENIKTNEPDLFDDSKLSNRSNCLIWILSGQVYNIPLKSLIQIKPTSLNRKNQTIAEAKVIIIRGGIIHLTQSENEEENMELNLLHNSLSLHNSYVFLEQSSPEVQKCVIYGSCKRRLELKSVMPSRLMEGNPPKIGDLINLKYKTKTGGIFYSKNFKKEEATLNLATTKIRPGGTLFYIPESTYKIDHDIHQLYIKNGDFIKANTEIFKDNFTNISGIVEIQKNKKMGKEITIKPGRLIPIKKDKSRFKSYHQKLLYPGEILLNHIVIKQLSFSELRTIHGENFIGIFPVVRYEITKDPHELNYFSSSSFQNNQDLSLGKLNPTWKLETKIKDHLPLQLMKREVLCQPLLTSTNFTVKFEFLQKSLHPRNIQLNLLIIEKFSIDKFRPNELKKTDLTTAHFSHHQQFLEPYTTLASFQILIPEKNNLKWIKEQNLGKERKLLLISDKDFQKVFVEQATNLFQENKLVRIGEKTTTNMISKHSGFISNLEGNSLVLHKGQPYLFSKGALLERGPGDLLKEGEALGQLVYERARTGDIVQGLPRIERILEARKPKVEATLATRPGIVIGIKYNPLNICIWTSPNVVDGSEKDKYLIKGAQRLSLRLLIGKFEFITVGQPLNDASVNPHTLLNIYFLHYSSLELLTSYHAAYRSLRKIQALLLKSVQAVYYSQGVSIADKHVEIIIKQMTGKVQITSSGDSPLLPDELVDLRQIHYINNSLREKENALFKPILLGITKASLKTTSFISAASFQHTTRVLTEAAVQGKIDWLRGLKENVIIGRLIPTGTGFNAYTDISYLGVKIPSLLKNSETKSPEKVKNHQMKFHQLKNRVKFKFVETR